MKIDEKKMKIFKTSKKNMEKRLKKLFLLN